MLHAAALQLGRSCRLWLAAGCAGCAGAPQSVQAQGRGAWLLAGLLQTALLPTAALCLPHLGRLPGCTSPAKSAAGLAHAYPLPFPTQHSLHTPPVHLQGGSDPIDLCTASKYGPQGALRSDGCRETVTFNGAQYVFRTKQSTVPTGSGESQCAARPSEPWGMHGNMV